MKNRKKVLILLLLVFALTGCTTYLKDDKGKVIKYNETGQTITKNILCKPKDKNINNIYEEYNKKAKKEDKVNYDKLPSCENLSIASNYEGLWTSIFVKPLAVLIVKIGELVKSYGLALILATLLIRAIAWPFTKKAALQSEYMKKAQPELTKLEKKYKNKTSQEQMLQKSQEMLLIYKKYNINPMTGCLFSFIQIPLFFAFYESIGRLPVVFEERFIGFDLGTSPLTALLNGQFHYLILIILIILATYYSFKLNSGAAMSEEQERQMKMMKNFMIVFMSFAAFSISAGIALYWITSNVVTIVQNLLVKRGKNND